MKRKRLLLIPACLAAVLLGAYVTLWLTRSRVNEENAQAIRIGMSEEEVEGILGGPGEMLVKNAKWSSKVWMGEVHIIVDFDRVGRVFDKSWRCVLDDYSFLAKLRRWLWITPPPSRF